MTVREKLNERGVRANVLSVGLQLDECDFTEFVEEEFDLIPDEMLDREILSVKEFKDDPLYIELVLK